jgi:hypothetical protein
MGDQAELFTDEEKVILGEKEPEPPKEPETPAPKEGETPPEPGKTEPIKEEVSPEEKEAAEAQGFKIVTDKGKTYFVDDEGTKIPAKRFKSVYREGQDNKRLAEEKDQKFNLFRELGPEKYYEVYPDEKPAGWKPPEKPKETPADAMPALGNMIVKGGPHEGKTLNEVWQEDPAFASYLQTTHLNAERDRTETEKQTQERIRQESENEVNAFSGQLAKDLFGKESDKLSPKEEKKIGETIQSVLDWMAKTRRGGGMLADSYFLMNKDGILADARAKGGKEAIESLSRKPVVPSVNTGGGAAVLPFSGYEEMSADQLAVEFEKMGDAGAMKFLKEAPASLRAKHPGLPWS